MIAARMANLGDGQRADYQAAQICAPVKQEEAADLLNVSRRSVQDAKLIEREAPELAERVMAGEYAFRAKNGLRT
jgi:hypothetical protein